MCLGEREGVQLLQDYFENYTFVEKKELSTKLELFLCVLFKSSTQDTKANSNSVEESYTAALSYPVISFQMATHMNNAIYN